MSNKRVCIVATVPFVIKWFMTSHIKILSDEYDVTLVANGTADDLNSLLGEKVSFVPIEIERKISVKNDIISLLKLWQFFRKEDFSIVHSIMPKSGLLAMLAARFSKVPMRFHTFTGQIWVNKKGIKRYVLKVMDRILVQCATMVLADSPSQREFLITNKIVVESKIKVLADGSIAGVDLQRFAPSSSKRKTIRLEYDIPSDAIVFLFVGRLNKDKGIPDLLSAFANIASTNKNLHLMLVGPDEANFGSAIINLKKQFAGRVHRFGFTDCPEDFMSAADVLCLPSHREGFGNSIIEASAVGIPSIASRIYGIVDAVEENITGLLHDPGNIDEMSFVMLKFANQPELRHRMGLVAQERVKTCFSQERLAKDFLEFYRQQYTQHNTSKNPRS